MYNYTNELGGLPPSIFFFLFSHKAALPILLTFPLTLALLGTALAWRRIRSSALFFVTSFLSLLAIQSFLLVTSPRSFIFGGNQMYFASAAQVRMSALTATENAFLAALFVLIIGVPLMYWLYRALRPLTHHSSGTR